MIEIGTLVRSVDDGVIGVITNWLHVGDPKPEMAWLYNITWADNAKSMSYADEFEVME